MLLGQLLINYNGKFWHHFYGKYKKLLTDLIALSFFYKMFLKIVLKIVPLGLLLKKKKKKKEEEEEEEEEG